MSLLSLASKPTVRHQKPKIQVLKTRPGIDLNPKAIAGTSLLSLVMGITISGVLMATNLTHQHRVLEQANALAAQHQQLVDAQLATFEASSLASLFDEAELKALQARLESQAQQDEPL